MQEKIKLRESRNGFSERDMHSKAILNNDSDSLMKYKIQRSRMIELSEMRSQFNAMMERMNEIENLLQKTKTGG